MPVVLVLIPAVQSWLLRRLVAQRANWRLEFEKFGVGFRGLDARGLDFAMPGLTAKSAPIIVRVLPSQLLRGELHVEQADVQRLRIEFTPEAFASANNSSDVPFAGVLALLRAPLPWVVSHTAVDAEFVVNRGGRAVVVSRLGLRGGDLGAGRAGEFAYELSAELNQSAQNSAQMVRSRGTLRIAQDTAHGIERIELKGDLTFPTSGPLAIPSGSFELSLVVAPKGERYAATVRLGSSGEMSFQGELDRVRSRIEGTVGFRLDQSVAAGLLTAPLPTASLSGKIVFGHDLKTDELDATLAGEINARDWQNLRAELGAIDALSGRVDAALAIRHGRAELIRAGLTLRGLNSPAGLQVSLSGPLALPATSARGEVNLTRFPALWANPWLGSGLRISAGEISAVYSLALEPDGALRLVATRPTTFEEIALRGANLPVLPPISLRVSPEISISRTRATAATGDLLLSSRDGDRVTGKVSMTHDFPASSTQVSGEISGEIPTLFSTPQQASPFALGVRWGLASDPAGLHVSNFEFAARRAEAVRPALSISLHQPIDIGGDPDRERQRGDLLKLEVHDLPLAWLSRWLPNRDFTGAWSTGESVLRRAASGRGFVFATRTPWTLTGLGVAIGGKTLFRGEAKLAPEFELAEERSNARLAQLELADLDGNRVTGEAEFTWREPEKKFAATLALDAKLPSLPGSKETFGALTASLRAQAGSMEQNVSQVEKFHLQMRRSDGPLFTIEAPQPFLFASKPDGERIFTSVAPLTVEVARIPLVWLRPWLAADVDIRGFLEPTKLILVAEPQKFLLRATQPVGVTDFSYSLRGVPRVSAARGVFSPGADLRVFHRFQPAFELGYSGRLYATDGELSVAGQRAIEFEGALGFLGNDKGVLPDGADLAARIDFAALHRLPVLAEVGVPAAGELVLRANGNLRDDPPEFWVRLSGIPTLDGKRVLPALEVSGHGRTEAATRTIHFDVAAQLATAPKPSDVAFAMDVALGPDAVPIASTLRSKFFDVGELMALAGAFTPPRGAAVTPAASGADAAGVLPTAGVAAEPPPVATAPSSAARLGAPFWGRLRGHFDLELDSVQFTPYRVDGVRGRLEVTDRALALTGLAGEMFAGRWRGGLRVDYDAAAPAGDHALAGNFRIEQFETARAIQTAFPNEFGSLDTRLDLDVAVQGAGNRWWELLDRAQGDFAIDARGGTARLTHPQLGTASTVLALAGTLSFSSEMRALGRLLKKFSEMPVDRLHVSGARDAAGDLVLSEFRLDSPQARLVGRGRVPAIQGVPLAARPLGLTMELQAKDEMALILGNMKLLEKTPQPDGFLRMKQPFTLGGEVGKPDPSPLYEILARAVDGSKGTWSLIMRKVQKEIEKQAPAGSASRKTSSSR